MGLLDQVDPNVVKNHMLYKDCQSAVKNLNEKIEWFKSSGTPTGQVKDVGQAIKRLLDAVDKGEKQFAGFAEWATLRADGLKWGKVLCDRYPTSGDLDSLGLRGKVKDHPPVDRMLLVPPDSVVKNNQKYKSAVTALEAMKKYLESFKASGMPDTQVKDMSQAIYRVICAADEGRKAFPDFGEWDSSFRKEALELARAVVEKFPTNAHHANIKPYVTDPDKRYC